MMIKWVNIYKACRTAPGTVLRNITHMIVKGLSQHSKLLKTIWQSSRRKLSELTHFFGFFPHYYDSCCCFLPLSALQRENLTPFDRPISEPKLQNSTVPCPMSFETFPLLGPPGSKYSTPFLGAHRQEDLLRRAEVAHSIWWEAKNFLSVTVTFKSIRN